MLELHEVAAGSLAKVNLSIGAGEVVCLDGPSGSGKTRLLRAIADLEPHDGEIQLGTDNQQALPAHLWRRKVSLIPAESQWWADTVGAHFDRVEPEHLAAMGFDQDVLGWSVSRLSSGEKQRLALLRGLAHNPEALLLDEPTANLDPALTIRVENWLRNLARERQMPVLWVAHDPQQIERAGDRHFSIQGNQIVPASPG